MEGIAAHILLLALLVGLSGVFSSSEIALVNLTPSQIRRMIKQEGKRGKRLRVWEREHDRILITIAIWNNLVNIAASAVAVTIFVYTLPKITVDAAAALATFTTTLLVLVFGEITPKLLAKRHSVAIALAIMPILIFLANVIRPVSNTLWVISRNLLRLLGKEKLQEQPIELGREEMREHFDLVRKNGVLTEKENRMLNAILRLNETKVRDIMVSRVNMACLDSNTDYAEVIAFINKTGFSRIPVYKGDIENIKGVLMAKDILSYWGEQSFRLSAILRPANFVPEMITVNNLLRDFMNKKIHLAIVVNEYGGVEGLVTLEDVIEEITGEIYDEYDIPSLVVKS